MNYRVVLLALAFVGVSCERWRPAAGASDVPGEYLLNRQGRIDASNRLVFESDGGVCHAYVRGERFRRDCGAWSLEFDHGLSYVGMGEFLLDDDSQPLMPLGYEFERVGGRRRLIVSADDGVGFYRIEAGP